MKITNVLLALTLLVTPAFAEEKKMDGNGDPVAAVRALEARWEAAYMKNDKKAVAALLAKDFMGVSTENKVMNKAQLITESFSDVQGLTGSKMMNTKTRAYGPDVVVEVGDSQVQGKGKDGKAYTKTYRYTDTWVMRDGAWLCVAEQVALVK